MTTLIWDNAKLYADAYDLSGDVNQIRLTRAAELHDVTTFGSGGTRVRQPGLEAVSCSYAGFMRDTGYADDDLDEILDAMLAGTKIVTIAPTGAIGAIAYSFRSTNAELVRGGSVGEPMAISGRFEASKTRAIRGILGALGQWGAADDDRFLLNVLMKATAYTLDATTLPAGESARCVTATHTPDGASDTLGNLVIDGTDEDGTVIQETLALVDSGTAYGIKAFATVTGLRTATWVQGGGATDSLKVGFGTQTPPFQLGAVAASEPVHDDLGIPDLSVDDHFLATVAMQAAAYTLTTGALPAGNPPRNIIVTHATVATTDTLGNLVVDGTDYNDDVIQETIVVSADGVAVGTKAFKTVTQLRTASWVIGGITADNIKVGFGDLVGLSALHTAVGEILDVLLGGVDDTPAAVAVSASVIASNTVDFTGAFDGAKTAVVIVSGTATFTVGERLYAALHVLAASGTNPTLDVTVESDAAEGMTSPTTRLTFTQKTTLGAFLSSVAGAITDDWWRIRLVVGGTATPKFTLASAFGVR